jgi:UDP-GlcNAc:undecaprenyl-phosphate GlcNAc-1-phosphate transferase
MLRTVVLHRRRLLEVLLDFVLISACFTVAYVLIVQGTGTSYQRHVFTVALPAVLVTRYIAFILLGLYQGIWRFAGSREAASIVVGVVVSELAAAGIVVATVPLGGFPLSVFVLDALLCIPVIGASRFGERALFRARSTLRERDGRRTLIVGAGRSGRSLLRELRETPGERVVGFVDDDPRLHRRRLLGVAVRGGTLDIDRILDASRPDAVLVTIPLAPADRLDAVVRACAAADVPCRFVRRETDLDPVAVLGAAQGPS